MSQSEDRDERGNRTRRRGFLAAGLAAGLSAGYWPAAAAMPAPGAAPPDGSDAPRGELPVRSLGKTGRRLPILGFGGAALPKVWLNPLSTEDRVKLVRYAYDRGLRYFDTAGNYYESQSILGEALHGIRKDVFLVSKIEATDPTEVRGAIERSLKELRTEYLDAALIHGTPGLEQMSVSQAMRIHAALGKLRDEKLFRHIGFSAHGYFDKALALVASGGFDMCMVSYGYVPRGYDQVHSSRMLALRDACLAKAHEFGMGIVAMKVVGAGLLGAWASYVVPAYDKKALQRLPAAAIRYVLQDERIHVLNIGMRIRSEIDTNWKILTEQTAYSLEDRALLAEFSARLYETDAIKKMRIE